jgi:hypothetical protein
VILFLQDLDNVAKKKPNVGVRHMLQNFQKAGHRGEITIFLMSLILFPHVSMNYKIFFTKWTIVSMVCALCFH